MGTKREAERSTVPLYEILVHLLTRIPSITSRAICLELNGFDLVRLLLRRSRELEADRLEDR